MLICMSSQVNLHTLNGPEVFMTEIALKSWLPWCGFDAPYLGDLGEAVIFFHVELVELFTHKEFYQLIVKMRINDTTTPRILKGRRHHLELQND